MSHITYITPIMETVACVGSSFCCLPYKHMVKYPHTKDQRREKKYGFSETRTQRRITVREASGGDLFKGAVAIAAGTTLISCLTLDISTGLKGALLVVGCLLCLYGAKWVRKYLKDDKTYREYAPEWDDKHFIYDCFAKGLNAWYRQEELPEDADGDIAYFLKLQRERLRNKGLQMEKRVVPTKGTGYGTGKRSRKSLWYTTDMFFEQVSGTLAFHNANETVFEQQLEMTMYEIVAHTPDTTRADQIRVTCPQCGAVNAALKLEEGCPYCGTRFRIRDLFPRVVNFFFIKTKSIASYKQIFTQTMTLSMASVFIITLFHNIFTNFRALPSMLFNSFMMALLAGGMIGYLVGDARLLAAVFDRDGMKHISLLKWTSSKRKITNTMLKYDKKFSFDKFEGQLVALVRMAVLAEKPENLACYAAGTRDAQFADILEMTYTNGLCLNKLWLEGDQMHMSIRTWWINYYENDGKIKKCGDCIDTVFVKNISRQEEPGFSITSVFCPDCGGSFDAVRQRICPYCGKEYHMENESWIIEKMHLIR